MKSPALLRLLILILALACLAGCAQPAAPESQPPEATNGETEATGPEDTQQELGYRGLSFCLPADFSRVEGQDRAVWTDGSITVVAETHPLTDYEAVADLESLVAHLAQSLPQPEQGSANGVCYLAVAANILGYYDTGLDPDAVTVLGVYLTGNTVGILTVMGQQWSQALIDYATAGTVADYYVAVPEQTLPPDSAPEPTDPEEPEEPADPDQPSLTPSKEKSLTGLHFKVPADSVLLDQRDGEYAYYLCGDVTVNVSVHYGPATDIAYEEAKDLAAHYKKQLAATFSNIKSKTYNEKPVLTYTDSGEQAVIGFYMSGEYFWAVKVYCGNLEVSYKTLAKLATSGWVVEEEVPAPEASSTQVLECQGLTITMDQRYDVDGNGSTSIYAYCGEAMITINRHEENERTAQELLDSTMASLEGVYDSMERKEQGGVAYLLCQDVASYTDVMVIYVSGTVYWEVVGNGMFTDEELQTVIDCLTAGVIEGQEPPETQPETQPEAPAEPEITE